MLMLNAKALGMKACMAIIGIFPWENMIICKVNYFTLLLVFLGSRNSIHWGIHASLQDFQELVS